MRPLWLAPFIFVPALSGCITHGARRQALTHVELQTA
jgi:hypothetical protein